MSKENYYNASSIQYFDFLFVILYFMIRWKLLFNFINPFLTYLLYFP